MAGKRKTATPADAALVARALGHSAPGLDSGRLLQGLIDSWGGPDRFAKDIFAEYQNSRPGGQTRQRILEMITRLTVQTTAQDLARPRDPADMTTDELVATAAQLLERLRDAAAGPPAAAP